MNDGADGPSNAAYNLFFLWGRSPEAVSKHCGSWKKDRGHAWPERWRLAGMTVPGTAVC
jgi:hypothetical protein